MWRNQKDGGQRRYLMVQLPEHTEEQSASTPLPRTCGERMRLAGKQVRSAAPTLDSGQIEADAGFRAYALAQSNFTHMEQRGRSTPMMSQRQLGMAVQHVAQGSVEDSMLTELLLKAGYPLTSPVEVLSRAGVECSTQSPMVRS